MKFKTPETVIYYFADNLKEGRIDNIIKICCYYNDDIVSKIDTRLFLDRVNVLNVLETEFLPNDYLLIKKSDLINSYLSQLKMLINSLLLDKEFEQ